MLVEDVMATDIVTCEAEATLRVAVERMLRAHVGSVIVTREGNPAGIVTETDALLAGYRTEKPFGEIPVRSVASDSLVTIQPSRTVRSAIQLMREEAIKKLPVVEGLDLVGILTMTDITRHYGDIVREIHDLERPMARREWASEDSG
jgi:CBS domain-containing protein